MLIQSALVALLATAAGALKPLVVQGTQFVQPDIGSSFQMVGMAYQPGGSAGYSPQSGMDPLSNPEKCMRDAALMQILGINTIRVYNLDPNINHDGCASIFNAAGMYMIIDVNSPLVAEAITSFEPWTSYYSAYLNHTFAVVEAFSNYPNTLLFFSGNEVINDLPSAEFVPPYLRAVTRDLKSYIKNNIERQIPVGYSAADVREILWDTWNYMQCSEDGEDDDMSRADIFALNSYSWCGAYATYTSSKYKELVDGFKDSSVPIFFSEYGCIEPKPRYWNEINTIYGDKMTPVLSGGVVYEWTEEENGYGLVNITGDSLHIMGDYNRLKAKLSKIDWKDVQTRPATDKKVTPPKCESSLIQEKGFNSNFDLPVLPPGAPELVKSGISPKPSGKLIDISDWDVKMTVENSEGKVMDDLKVVPLKDDEINWFGRNAAETGSTDADSGGTSNNTDTGGSNSTSANNSTNGNDDDGDDGDGGDGDDDEGAAILIRPLFWAIALPLAAMMFA